MDEEGNDVELKDEEREQGSGCGRDGAHRRRRRDSVRWGNGKGGRARGGGELQGERGEVQGSCSSPGPVALAGEAGREEVESARARPAHSCFGARGRKTTGSWAA